MSKDVKSKVYLLVFALTAFVLGWGVYKNYKPEVIYGSCVDITDKTVTVQTKKHLPNEQPEKTFDELLNECLSDAGYYQ